VRNRPRRLSEVDPTRRALVLAWWAFTATFGLLRLLTWLIHIHVEGLGNVSAGGLHLHHYLYGILLLIFCSVAGLIGISDRWSPWVGLAFGLGLALVVDEVALLVELKDVYWDGQGGVSIGVAVILIGLVGSTLAFTHAKYRDDKVL
jgi:hypothetical protein